MIDRRTFMKMAAVAALPKPCDEKPLLRCVCETDARLGRGKHAKDVQAHITGMYVQAATEHKELAMVSSSGVYHYDGKLVTYLIGERA
jgi:hypothetical protein